MARPRAIATIALLLLLASGCSSGDEVASALDGNEYWSTGVTQNGEPFTLVENTRIIVSFTGDQIRASAGCNSIGGTASVQGGELRASDLSMTEMGCDPDRMGQDNFLIELLTSTPAVTVDGDMLRLETASASIDFVNGDSANPDRPLQGTTWEVDGFLSGSTASSFATNTRGMVVISDNIMQLFDGCATVDLPIEISDSQVQFDPVALPPADDCDAPAGYRQSIYTALSRGALAFTIDGTNLTLATPDNVGITFRAVE